MRFGVCATVLVIWSRSLRAPSRRKRPRPMMPPRRRRRGPPPPSRRNPAPSKHVSQVLWTYEHDKPIAGLYYDKGMVFLASKDNQLVRLTWRADCRRTIGCSCRARCVLGRRCTARRATTGTSSETQIFVIQHGDMLWCIEPDSMRELWARISITALPAPRA